MTEPIDPRDFGRVEAEVKSLQEQVSVLTRKLDGLIELANKGRGGFWMGMTIASFIGGLATFFVEKVVIK